MLPAAAVFGQMTAPLTLGAWLATNRLQVQWPLSAAGMTLTTTTALAPVSVWLPVTNSVQTTGTTFYTTLPVSNNAPHYYRLKSN